MRFPEWDIDTAEGPTVADLDRPGLGDPAGAASRSRATRWRFYRASTSRRYESPMRRQQALETRERIIDGGMQDAPALLASETGGR